MIGLSPIEQMPVIMLLVTIAVLFAISYLVTDASLKGTREVSFEIKSDSLDKQYLFWLGIIVPIGVFFYLEYFVFLSKEIGFNSAGFKDFFNESKLPLGVLALSPIFGVIVSNIHRTIQTEKQILVTERKNKSDYIKLRYDRVYDIIKSISVKIKVEKDPYNKEKYIKLLSNDIYKIVIELDNKFKFIEIKNSNIHGLMNRLYPINPENDYLNLTVSNLFIVRCIAILTDLNEFISDKIKSNNFGKIVELNSIDEYKISLTNIEKTITLSDFLYLDIGYSVTLDSNFDFNLNLTKEEIIKFNEIVKKTKKENLNDYPDYTEVLRKAIYIHEMSELYIEVIDASTRYLIHLVNILNSEDFKSDTILLSQKIDSLVKDIHRNTNKLLQPSMFLIADIANGKPIEV